MPTPLIITLGVVTWIVVACGLAWVVGGAFKLGEENDETGREVTLRREVDDA